MSGRSLVAVMRDARPQLAVADALAPILDELVARARLAWPDVELAPADFIRFVAARVEGPVERELAALCGDDLYLACACVAGDPRALAAFERAFASVIERAVASAGCTRAESADVCQVVRQRLLVPAADEALPRIATYSGRGKLRSWIRVIATREAARFLPRARREVGAADGELGALVTRDDDPEIGYLKRLYRAEFKLALREAIEALPDRDRLLLRQHALDGLGADELAAFHRVHRATTARWLEAARRAVLDSTRRALIAKLRLGTGELDSVMRLIASQLDHSLPELLRR
jgi:RNA polymerase sigma-70 factor (ECF subfamily)